MKKEETSIIICIIIYIKHNNAVEKFYTISDNEILCKDITGKKFKTIDDQTLIIENGGCKELINHLVK